ncbi:MAG: polar amino acid transport system ATP-binding protein [Rhodospirillaceae bacterium]|jgi:ABC-type polar amino acid transport system ATPase subunit|nr:polar amino acid transport system ATP-binding protein [Rhodospirillaceae bacterium]
MSALLVIRGLSKRFGTHEVLDSVDMSVERGETVAIIGPSGSGKSTLLRCVNRLEEPSAGTVLFDGEPVVAGPGLRAQRARMGMVFQHFNLFSHMTVLGNIIEAPIQVLGLSREEAVARAGRLLDRVGLADKADSYPARLSGGQKQRVAIARCLAMEPKLLLLDEITSALDPELVGEVLQVIRGLAGQGMTMMIVTHEMGFAREVADRVVFMDGGQIVEQGAPDELLVRPATERLRRFLSAVLNRTPLEPIGQASLP